MKTATRAMMLASVAALAGGFLADITPNRQAGATTARSEAARTTSPVTALPAAPSAQAVRTAWMGRHHTGSAGRTLRRSTGSHKQNQRRGYRC